MWRPLPQPFSFEEFVKEKLLGARNEKVLIIGSAWRTIVMVVMVVMVVMDVTRFDFSPQVL